MTILINRSRLPRVPTTLSTGLTVQADTNFFEASMSTKGDHFQYDVKVVPEFDNINLLIRKNQSAVTNALKAERIIPNNAILYAIGLPAQLLTDVDVRVQLDDKEFTLLIVRTADHSADITLAKDKTRQACNHAIRDAARKLNFSVAGEFIYDTQPIPVPNANVRLLRGYMIKLQNTVLGHLVNVDIKHRIVQNKTAMEVIQRDGFDRANEYLAKRKVLTTHMEARNPLYTVLRVIPLTEMTPLSTFSKDGKDVKYTDYFKNTYRKTINPKGYMLECENGRNKLSHLPAELCVITGLDDALKADANLMDLVAAITRMAPVERHRLQVQFVQQLNNSERARAILDDMGLTLSNRAVRVDGQRLKGQNLKVVHTANEYSNMMLGRDPNARDEMNIDRPDFPHYVSKSIVGLLPSGPPPVWVVVGLTDQRNGAYLDSLAAFLRDQAKNYKMTNVTVKHGLVTPAPGQSASEAMFAELRKLAGHPSHTVAVFVLPFKDGDKVYKELKVKCSAVGVPSQKIKFANATTQNERKRSQIFGKVFVQIVAKKNGVGYTLDVATRDTPTQFIGIESAAGMLSMVATVDAGCVTSYSDIRRNDAEVGTHLKLFVETAFKKAAPDVQGAKRFIPKHVVVYRSGISEGQKAAAFAKEMEIIASAMAMSDSHKNARLTYVFVNTDIHQRFTLNRNGTIENSPSLTVYDSGIVAADKFDFYITHQNVTQGCLTPTHYDVYGSWAAQDATTPQIPADKLKLVTAQLSCNYQNWSGPIRVPSVVMNARKQAAVATALDLAGKLKEGWKGSLYYL